MSINFMFKLLSRKKGVMFKLKNINKQQTVKNINNWITKKDITI